MIYLISGAPRCGKTILAKKIAANKKIGWVSTDRLWSVVFASTPKSQLKRKFPGYFLAREKGKYHFELHSLKTILDKEIIEAKSIWPGVIAFIRSTNNFKQDFVIEGIHLLPSLVNQLKETKYWPKIKIIYLIKTDLEKIKEGIPKNKEEFDWLLAGGIDNPSRLDGAAKMIRYESQYFKQEA
ncbi:MAG: hypothetical protein NT116_06700, partial [Candidatus Parcubacteria bacterium]|nr:hypothetical protein [Candidatus Parcubacteria bacterium]